MVPLFNALNSIRVCIWQGRDDWVLFVDSIYMHKYFSGISLVYSGTLAALARAL